MSERCLTTDCKNEARYQSGLCGVCDAQLHEPTIKAGLNVLPDVNALYDLGGAPPVPTHEAVRVLFEVGQERLRQHEKWGEQNWPDGTSLLSFGPGALVGKRVCDEALRSGTVTWADIFNEEYFEVLSEEDPIKLRDELIQVAALAVQWVEAIDRRGAR